MSRRTFATPTVLILCLGLGSAGCNPKPSDSGDAAPAPVDTASQPSSADTAAGPNPVDSTLAPGPDTSVATPPITPPPQQSDTPPASTEKPSQPAGGGGGKFSRLEYEGWRQYSVNCARCHGQDVLPNPVAANLLVSVAPGGPMASPEKFSQVVSEGRPDRGMPAFKSLLTPAQINATYAYVKGRAEKRLPPGRPAGPQG